MSGRTGARASLDALLPISEFPDGLNPVFVRDLRQGLRAPFFMWAFVLLHGFAIIATMAAWAAARVLGGSLVVSAAASGFVTNLIFGFLLPLSLFHSLQPELGRDAMRNYSSLRDFPAGRSCEGNYSPTRH